MQILFWRRNNNILVQPEEIRTLALFYRTFIESILSYVCIGAWFRNLNLAGWLARVASNVRKAHAMLDITDQNAEAFRWKR